MSNSILLGFLSLVILTTISGLSYKCGQKDMLIELQEKNTVILELQQQNHKKELEYTAKLKDLENEIKNSQDVYSNSINELNKRSSNELFNSERRAEYYRQQVKSCSTQSKNFAEHAAKLDRQLTEGISLVEELTEIIKLRDKQVEFLIKQAQLDRELIND